MPLKTEYNNPDVLLTTALTRFQRNLLKYVKCGSLIVITFFMSALSLYIGVLLSLAIWGVLILWTPQIAVADARSGTEMQGLGLRVQQEFHVIHEPEHLAGEFGV